VSAPSQDLTSDTYEHHKYAHAKKVTLSLYVKGERFEITVKDDRRGFDRVARARKGRGINNIAKRAAEMGGSATITGEHVTFITIKITQ
jgi:signal transduction histidine kinase